MGVLSCDVLIVGGGPAGLSVAEALPAHVSKVVLHQDREIGKPVRTSGGTWVRDMKALSVPEHLYHVVNEVEFHSDTEQSRHTLHDWTMAVLDVTGLYQWIGARAQSNGARILCGTKFLSTKSEKCGCLSTARVRGGAELQIRSSYIVDASGVQAAVMSDLGIAPKPTRVGVGVEYDFAMPQGVSDRAVLLVGAQVLTGYGWIFPAPGNTLRIGAGVIHPDTDVSPRDLMASLITPEFLQRHDLKLGPLVKTNAGLIPSVPYDPHLVHNRVIRVGDTANFATPTVGEGIRQAMEYGRLLGAALGDVLETGRDAPLRRYERRARRQFSRDYRMGFMTNRRIATYSPEDWDKSVRRISRLSEKEMAALLRSEFSPATLLRTAAKQIWHKIRH